MRRVIDFSLFVESHTNRFNLLGMTWLAASTTAASATTASVPSSTIHLTNNDGGFARIELTVTIPVDASKELLHLRRYLIF